MKSDHQGWRNALVSIGRTIGRPGLADEARAIAGGGLLPAVRHVPSSSQIAAAGFVSAAITAIGAALLSAVDPSLRSGYWALLPGAGLAALPFAVLFWRLGALNAPKALGLVVAFVAAFGIAAFVAILAITPLPFPLRSDAVRPDRGHRVHDRGPFRRIAVACGVSTARPGQAVAVDIDRAKGILMKAKNLTEETAYAMLRKTAMNENKKIAEVAQSVITAAELFK